MTIHKTAILAPDAKIDPSVEIGAYSTVGSGVSIGENSVIGAHCHIEGCVSIGRNNKVFPFVSIGCSPQDIKFSGERSFVRIGDGNVIREFVTVHSAEGIDNETVIGNGNFLMAYVHIAHNCVVANQVIMANCVTLAGHVFVGNKAVIGGLTGIHQFCHIGELSMIGGMSKIVKDVPPFMKVDGNPARIVGLNAIGLRRNDVPRDSIDRIRKLFRLFFRSGLSVSQALDELSQSDEACSDPFIKSFFDFVKSSKRGIYKRTREDNSEG
ncbi:acyl-ACP--UDP-N-acetylglucosamine O-acyltransferase [bacterium]|nr:acyl-ACP--UDP-N-acetylglucosamine O-acyltransferase [bacterium]